MKQMLLKLLCLTLLVLLSDDVTIYSISTDIEQLNYKPQGSIIGGTYVYIKATGLDQTASNNRVTIGPYECVIPEKGINEVFLTCQTEPAIYPTQRWGLKVTVYVLNKKESYCGISSCTFTYTDSATPEINSLVNRAQRPGQDVLWYGTWRVSTTYDIKKLFIGDQLCNLMDVEKPNAPRNLNYDDPISETGRELISCTVSDDQVAGYHEVSGITVWGFPREQRSTWGMSADGSREYQVMVVPEIKSVSANQGSEHGQQLTIKGLGFGDNSSNVLVTAGGLPCQVTSIKQSEIVCDVSAGQTVTQAQQGYHAGLGWEYEKYDLYKFNDVWDYQTLRNKINSNYAQLEPRILEKGFLTEIERVDTEDQRTGYWFKGYFKAPRSGNYRFTLSTDDNGGVWMNRVAFDKDRSHLELVHKSGYKSYRMYAYYITDNMTSEEIALEQDKMYYMEIFSFNSGGFGAVTFSVEVPNPDPNKVPLIPVPETQVISLEYQPTYEQWRIKVWDSTTPFAIIFRYQDPITRAVKFERITPAYAWNQWTDSNFRSQVDWAAGYYGTQVTSAFLDANGNVLADQNNATLRKGKQWDISFTLYRAGTMKITPVIYKYVIPTNKYTIQRLQDATYCIGGTYSLSFKGQLISVALSDGTTGTNIPFNTEPWRIRNALLSMLGADEEYKNLEYWYYNRYEDGVKFGLTFRGTLTKGDIPQIVADGSRLTGTGAKITVTELRKGSNNYFYEPVPGDMLFQPAGVPQIDLRVNGIQHFCAASAGCGYQTNPELNSQITSASYDEGTSMLSIGVTLSTHIPALDTKLLKITFGSVNCRPDASSTSTLLKCVMDGQPVAGNHKPIVLYQDQGYFQPPASSISVSLVVSAVSVSTLSTNGGRTVQITGKGFPYKLSSQLSVRFGAAQASQIKAVSNTQINVVVPKCDASNCDLQNGGPNYAVDVTVALGALSTTLSGQFTYSKTNVPIISSISKQSASPVVKQDITITGSNFGSVESDLKIFMDNATHAGLYEMGIVSVSDAQIVAVLPGGHVGTYYIRVQHQTYGDSYVATADANKITYEILITSITPQTGSVLGGTTVTIKGRNFCTQPVDNTVFITKGIDYNIQAAVVSVTKGATPGDEDEIVVVLPTPTDDFKVAEGEYQADIVVQGKLLEESACPANNCRFTFKQQYTATFTAPSTSSYLYNGNAVQLAASGVVGTAKVYVGTTQAVSTSSASQINYTVPNMPAGVYFVAIMDDRGFVQGSAEYKVNIVYALTNCAPTKIAYGGADITIFGSGLDASMAPIVTIGAKGTCQIQSIQSDKIVCRAPPSTSAGAVNIVYQQTGAASSLTLSSKLSYDSTLNTQATVGTYSSTEIPLTSNNLQLTGLTAYLELQGTKLRAASSAITSPSAGSFLVSFSSHIRAGVYTLFVHQADKGYATIANPSISISLPALSATSVISSQAGGKAFTITAAGNPVFNTAQQEVNRVSVCGFPAQVTAVSDNQLSVVSPFVSTKVLLDAYKMNDSPVLIKSDKYKLIGSNADEGALKSIDDNRVNTYFTQSASATCFVGYDYGSELQVAISKIQYTPKMTEKASKYIGLQIQGNVGEDESQWETLYTIDDRIHLAENYWKPNFKVRDELSKPFRKIRLFNSDAATGAAFCEMAEFQVIGVMYSKAVHANVANDLVCDVSVSVSGQTQSLSSVVTYRSSVTPKVTQFSPKFGVKTGGETIHVLGQGFGTVVGQVSVVLDGVSCAVTSVTDGDITCTTGDKHQYCKTQASCPQQTVEVSVNGNKAVRDEDIVFFYGLRYSQTVTWGEEAIPREGDSISVPKGEVLIVDQSTNILYGVIVEGILLFSDERDMTFDATYVIVRGGRLIIGEENQPYQHKVTITLHGNYEDAQLPEFGNKVIGCHHCTVDLHGIKKEPTWTELETTIEVGATTLKLKETTNWSVGDQIVIAPTDFDPEEAEQVQIVSIATCDSTKTCITFSPALKFRHISTVETYTRADGKVWSVPRKAEVAVLTRNIVIQGDENSMRTKYGGQLMFHGKGPYGTRGRIEHAEFRYTGQPKILGRYPIHFHMNGDVHDSYVIGAVVHHSNARVVTIHQVYFLLIKQCVGFYAYGHNFFLEDGIERFNLLIDNLSVTAKMTFLMLQTDITVSNYWITHPTNYVDGNHAAGSDFYGMWWEIKPRPDGPSATDDVCPRGDPFGSLTSSAKNWNVGHACKRFGLRLFQQAPRTHACQPVINVDATHGDMWADNPSLPTYINNFLAWKNGESGVLAEDMGNVVFDNIIMTDSFRAGFQAHLANITKEPVELVNSLIVGLSTGYTSAERVLHQNANSKGIIFPRTDGFIARNVTIRNFVSDMILVESSSENQYEKLWTQGAKQATVEALDIDASCSQAKRVRWQGPRANIIYDKGGSLTNLLQDAYIAPYKRHFDEVTECTAHLSTTNDPQNIWDNSVVCSQGIQLRGLVLRNFEILDQFIGTTIKVLNLKTKEIQQFLPAGQAEDGDAFGNWTMQKIKNKPYFDQKNSFAAVFATNYMYNVHFLEGIDFDHMLMVPTIETKATDKPFILRFNYSEVRELFDMVQWIAGKPLKLYYKHETLGALTSRDGNGVYTCSFGDYHHDLTQKTVSICLGGKNRVNMHEFIDVSGIYCRDTCPRTGFSCEKELGLIRKWSEATQWMENKTIYDPVTKTMKYGVPSASDHVILPCPWTVMLDVSYLKVKTLTLDGNLRIDASLPSVTIEAEYIWVRGGKLLAGDPNQPYPGQLTIRLLGSRHSTPLIIDDISDAGSKVLGVTGEMKFYGKSPATKFTRLTQNAKVGDTVIRVADDVSDWKAGDEIVLGPTEMTYTEFEKVTIAGISGQYITIAQPIQHFHYGHPKVTVSSSSASAYLKIDAKFNGELDMRGTVGHLTRNIKIVGSEEDGWGGQILVYHWILRDAQEEIDARGNIVLDGVELSNMGQKDNEKAGIHILYTNTDGDDTVIRNSSIHDCNGQCMNAFYAHHVILENNVFYNGYKFLMNGHFLEDWQITNNLFVGAKERPWFDSKGTTLWDPVALLVLYLIDLDPATNTMIVQRNIGQGSGGIGFVFPAIRLSRASSQGIKQNQVGVAKLLGVSQAANEDQSWWGGQVSVYHSHMGFFPVLLRTKQEIGFSLENIIAAECKKAGIVLRLGNGFAHFSSHFLKKSWVGSMIRQDCTECYQQATAADNPGSDNIGIQLNYVNEHAKHGLPLEVDPLLYDALCVSSSQFQATYLEDVHFYQFLNTYPGFSKSSNNIMMGIHPGLSEDYISPHYLTRVTSELSAESQVFRFLDPNENRKGWFGGCGEFMCTGRKNVYVQDMDGKLLGATTSITSYNPEVGFKLPYCQHITEWNGFKCTGNKLAVLEFFNMGEDRQLVLDAPVLISGNGFVNKINLWIEWEWSGPEPLNMRENNFVSLVELDKYYNITFNHFPFDEIYRISPKVYQSGSPSNYVIIQEETGSPLSVQVQVFGKYSTFTTNDGKNPSGIIFHFRYNDYQIKRQIPLSQQDTANLVNYKNDCGAHKYYYKNRTVIFVVNGAYKCSVRIVLTNMVQVTVDDFYNDDTQTSFINRMSAFLGISTDRLKIVGIRETTTTLRRVLASGPDTTVVFEIQSDNACIMCKDQSYSGYSEYGRLKNVSKTLEEGLRSKKVNLDQQFIEYEDNIYVAKQAGDHVNLYTETDYLRDSGLLRDEKLDSGLAIAFGVIFGLVGAGIIGYIIFNIWKKKRMEYLKKQKLRETKIQQAKDISGIEVQPQDDPESEHLRQRDDESKNNKHGSQSD